MLIPRADVMCRAGRFAKILESMLGGQKGIFLDSENGLPGLLDFGLCKGRDDSQILESRRAPSLLTFFFRSRAPKAGHIEAGRSDVSETPK